MTAGLIAAVGEVKPEFPQVLEFEGSVPTGVGKGGFPRQPLKKAAHLQVAVGRRPGPFLEDSITRSIGHEPVGPVASHIDGYAL